VQYVLRKLRIPFIVISRKADPKFGILSYEQLNDQLLQSATLWINTTPLGMYPNVDSCPPLNYSVIGDRHYLYDLVYNPAETLFLQKGKAQGAVTENGHDMLVIQAEEGWKIWNQQ
jgi:shikimate dehydrogenase